MAKLMAQKWCPRKKCFEEHEALFGDAGDFEDETKENFEIDAMAAGLDVDELELMDPDDRAETLEEAGLDQNDYDFD